MRRPAVLMLAAAAVLLLPTSAAAEAPVLQGWWTATNPGGLPAAVPAPDVPEDGLLVESGADAPHAYAALSYALTDGATAVRLTLLLAEGGVTGPGSGLVLCALEEPTFLTAQGGPLAEAPAYDCERTVVGTADAAGTAFAFDVGTLAMDGVLAVAVLPADASRVVLSPPDEQSLTTTPGPSNEDGTAGLPATDAGEPTFDAPAQEPALDGRFVLPPPFDDGLVVTAPAAPDSSDAAPPELAEQPPAAPLEPPSTAVTASGLPATEPGGGLRPVGLLVLAAGACSTVLWAFAGSSAPGQSKGAAAPG